MQRLIFCLLPFCLFTAAALADTSVWDQARQASNERTGKITSLANDGSDTVIRLASRGSRETFKLCSSFPGGDAMNLVEVERNDLVRTAYERGDTVKISFGGAFDRCVQTIEISRSVSADN